MTASPPVRAQRTLRTEGSAETEQVGAGLAAHLRAAVAEAGLTVALRGDLGAGKTVFVRGLARGLGLAPTVPVTSPTFTVAQQFALPGGLELVHLDLYRLRGAYDLENAGFEDACGKGRLTCVEWPERAPEALDPDRLEVLLVTPPSDAPVDPLQLPADQPRLLTLTATGPRSARLLDTWRPPAREPRR